MAIRGIFFDAAGVLYTRREPTSAYVARLLEARGLATNLSAPDQKRQRELRSQATCGLVPPGEYWDQLLQMHGVVAPEERRALAARITGHSDEVWPIAGGRQVLTTLKARGFALGIITDTIYSIERKKRWLDSVGVLDLIDVLACSTDLGLHKPDPAIYIYAGRQAGLTPGESAFVGHAVDELDGARQAGLATVAVHYDPGARAAYYVESLADLLDVPILRAAGA